MTRMPGAFLPDKAGSTSAVVQFHFTGPQATDWNLSIQGGTCKTEKGTAPDPNVSLTVESSDFQDLLAGRLEPMAAFMRGKLQLRGDVALAMRLPNLFGR